MAAVFEVHNTNGGGLAEEIYQQSPEIELTERGIPYASKPPLPVFYKGRQLQTFYKPDLLVGGSVVVELKAVRELTEEHEGQLFNYLRLLRSPVGYLINFVPMGKVEWKRYVLSEYLPSSHGPD